MNFAALLKSILKILLVVAILGTIGFFGFYLPLSEVGKAPEEFEGKVQDKWISVRETDMGSRFSRYILVKSDGGAQFKFVLDAETYNRIETGERVKRSPDGIIQTVK